ncbi:uncharacterized protein BJ212DRAFT_1481850 [Suillus subaureus]|uniref:Uncharacterized protein n=1 Tax=Suillus subaureus TaxID=48587 RepID=A0A9P7E9D9_9AGAM|nr:uncharacterized protein BJ212DRAFT_1489698 [Suillus subaureus]XP_041191977.1 uncharacterized protein BJ212DRAFT_1481850 [Suillus subaureus]KAG1795548.1 hypothetical protein BJ212DRAFT_1489698 [Suillus subaureus]KAG1814641.1 hypothetical protein BJ212DRAFT_1481850 [Suillus subaureus]
MKLSALFFVVASACTVLAAPTLVSGGLEARSPLEEAREPSPPDWKRIAQSGGTPDW